MADLEITDVTTVGDIMAALSEDEVTCLRDPIGAGTFDATQDIPLPTVRDGAVDLPFECLTPENAIGISIAFMSADAGGLSAETRSCVQDVAMEDPSVLGIGESPADSAGVRTAAVRMHLCQSDEEAAALTGDGDVALLPPSAMRCMAEQLGGLEPLLSFAEPSKGLADLPRRR